MWLVCSGSDTTIFNPRKLLDDTVTIIKTKGVLRIRKIDLGKQSTAFVQHGYYMFLMLAIKSAMVFTSQVFYKLKKFKCSFVT